MQLLRVGAEVLRRQGEDEIFIWFGGMMVIILVHIQPRIKYVYLVSLYYSLYYFCKVCPHYRLCMWPIHSIAI